MTPERWSQIERLFHAATEQAQEQRSVFLDQACEGDAELRVEVAALLAEEETLALLKKPAIEHAPSLVGDNEVVHEKRFGPYQVISQLGKGGMGEVFRAHDPKLGRDVAIKTLPREFADESEWLARFRREARMLAALNHPNIAAIYGLEESEGTHFLVMELVEGGTLAERIADSNAVPVTEALKICGQVAEALEAAHEKAIAHRDIKPSNIKVTPQGRVKVLDFGIAKTTWHAEINTEPSVTGTGTETGRMIGTPGYMSPEQVRGTGVDHRADIWAFGCVLYELLAGRRAFRGDTVNDTLAKVLEREPDWRALPPSIPSKVRGLLEQCLRKDPQQRLSSIGEARRQIEATLSGGARTRRNLVAAVIATAIVIAGAAAFRIANPGGEATSEPVAAVVKPITSLRGWEMRASWSPDGTLMTFSNNIEGSMDLFVIPVAGGDPIRLTKGPADEVSPAWSPDGKYLAYAADPGTGTAIYLMPPLGGAERKLIETGTCCLAGLGATPWSPDGQELLYTRRMPAGATALWRVNVSSGEPAQVTFPPAGQSDSEGSLSFDGSRILFLRRQGGRETLWMGPAGGGEPKQLFAGERTSWPAWSADGKRVVFTSTRTGPLNLWEVEVESGRVRQITTGPGWDMFATVSRSGRLAYTSFSHTVDLYAARIDPREEERLTAHSRESFHPSFSPNGRKLVYQSDRTGNQEIWMLDRDTKTERQLTNNPASDTAPDWSPDGREIAFTSTREGKTLVWVMDAEGGSQRPFSSVVVPDAGHGWTDGQVIPRWSPDGKSIAFKGVTDRGDAVWVADRDGSNGKPVLYGATYFDWYRDHHLVFTSSTGAPAGIRVADLRNGDQTVLRAEQAIELAVSRDGRSLLYTHSISHFGMNLFTVPLAAGPGGMPRAAAKPRQFTDGRAEWHAHKGQWSPDGKTIVYTRDADQGDVYVVENYK